MTLRGKNAIVTGSTSGIGEGIARSLAAAGCNIMLNGLGHSEDIERSRQSLVEEFGVRAGFHPADMTKPDEIADMIDKTVDTFDRVDILVNNAGIQHVSSIEDFPIARWQQIMDINLTAVFLSTRAALPHMKKQGFGRILNVASAHGLVGSAQKSAYVAAKHGVVGLTKVTALETAQQNITCNAICPGWVLTPLVQAQIEKRAKEGSLSLADAERDLLSEKQPSLRFVTLEELGGLAVYLSGDLAQSITGATVSMDGGWTAQ